VCLVAGGCGSSVSGDPRSGVDADPSLLIECEPDPDVHILFDGPTYEDMAALTEAADVVVAAEVVEDRECVVDSSNDPPGNEYAITRVEVDRYLKGEGPQRLAIVQPAGDHEGTEELVTGERLVLFLGKESNTGSDLEAKVGPRWYPLNWDNGVADLAADDTLQVRYAGLPRVSLDAVQHSEPLAAREVAELRVTIW
jgi:hypothetical protein